MRTGLRAFTIAQQRNGRASVQRIIKSEALGTVSQELGQLPTGDHRDLPTLTEYFPHEAGLGKIIQTRA